MAKYQFETYWRKPSTWECFVEGSTKIPDRSSKMITYVKCAVTGVMQGPEKESLGRVAAEQCVSIDLASCSNHPRKSRGLDIY